MLPKFFLDSCDPAQTKEMIATVGKIDGQTTNPTLLVKNPEVQRFVAGGKRIKESDLLTIYKEAIVEIAHLTDGAVSVEVYADWHTTTQQMLTQAEEMFGWAPHVYMKFPTVPAGLQAAHEFTSRGGRVNMTLVFDQLQAAAVYSATRNTHAPAFVSPFVGRWDDRGYQGVDLVKNIVAMYRDFDAQLPTGESRDKPHHVEVLAASVRTMDHFYASIAYGADIITAPLATFQKWVAEGRKEPEAFTPSNDTLKPLEYQKLTYTTEFQTYKINDDKEALLFQGLKKFADDWNGVVER